MALAECTFGAGLGAKLVLPGAGRADALLFGEDASRIVIAYAKPLAAQVAALAAQHGVTLTVLGQTGGDRLVLSRAAGVTPGEVLLDAAVAALKKPWDESIPAVAGEAFDPTLAA